MTEKLFGRLVKRLAEIPADGWKYTSGLYDDDSQARDGEDYSTSFDGINVNVIRMVYVEAYDKYVINVFDSQTKMEKRFPDTKDNEICGLYARIKKSKEDAFQQKLTEEKRKREEAEKEFEDRLWGILDG